MAFKSFFGFYSRKIYAGGKNTNLTRRRASSAENAFDLDALISKIDSAESFTPSKSRTKVWNDPLYKVNF